MPKTAERERNLYGDVNSKTGLRNVFLEIRKDIDGARSREDLTELHRRAGYMITLTYAPSWQDKFGKEAAKLRTVAEEEFARTARRVNARAKEIGVDADYKEKWGD